MFPAEVKMLQVGRGLYLVASCQELMGPQGSLPSVVLEVSGKGVGCLGKPPAHPPTDGCLARVFRRNITSRMQELMLQFRV